MGKVVGCNASIDEVRSTYEKLVRNVDIARRRLGRSLTFAEKVLFGHANDVETIETVRGLNYGDYRPDRVAMQDATAQMALLQFMIADLPAVSVPTTVHCDHLIQARVSAQPDLAAALEENDEVYDFLASVSAKYGIGFWKPGQGIIHQVVLEHYAFPGGMMIGTDSHTPNAGGLGMIAIGVGGADAVDVMAGWPFNTRVPQVIGVRLSGELSGWASAKDVILKVAGILTVKGGTGAIIEYFGPGVSTIAATGKATICNMGAEIGATCSVFPFDDRMAAYMKVTERAELAVLAEQHSEYLRADPEVASDPERYFNRVIDVNLSELEPHLVGPGTPDLDRPLSAVSEAVKVEGYPARISQALVGSCTNSSYEDIGRAAHVARQAAAAGIRVQVPLLVTPGSEQIRATIARDGLLADLEAIGATVMANACGPCIGQWKRTDTEPGEVNTIVSSFNRNFPARNDGNPSTLSFIASPETVTAMALTGRLDVDFVHEPLTAPDGSQIQLRAPEAAELPAGGFDTGEMGFVAPATDPSTVSVVIAPGSERLEALVPFAAWDGSDFLGLQVLLKATGKCTTDHISPAGRWLQFRGHLSNISDNLFIGANNAFSLDEPGTGIDVRDRSVKSLATLAREYKDAGIAWVAIGDENYGEGSSREHAAMEPRYMGARAIIARSFARIHEANLKKQGVLALTFAKSSDYERILVDDKIDICGLQELAPNVVVNVVMRHADCSSDEIETTHTMSDEHIGWFRAGSALNLLGANR